MSQYIIVGEQSYPIDSALECEAADGALTEAGLSEAPVWAGDCDDPDSHRGRVYFLHSPAEEAAYAADCRYDQERDDRLTGDC